MNKFGKNMSAACDDEKRSTETLEPIQVEDDEDANIARLIGELNAAKHDLMLSASCKTCKNEGILSESLCAYCGTLDGNSNEINYWKWRGVCAENKEKGGDASHEV